MFAPGLYAILDLDGLAARPDGLGPPAAAAALIAGGCVALQLRAKGAADPLSLLPLARELSQLARAAGRPFIVNDSVALAARCGATGVHLGQHDGPIAAARAALGAGQLVGRSTHSLAQAEAARSEGADYLGFGPIFDTDSKADAEPTQGLEALARVCARVGLPVVAIGGITTDRAGRVARQGAAAAAAIGAILGAVDPATATREFGAAFEQGRPADL